MSRLSNSLFFTGFTVLALGAIPASAQDTLKIGAPVSTSGRYVAYGTQAKNGIETAVEMWKKVRGDKVAGRSIDVIMRDTQSNNAITVSLMNALHPDRQGGHHHRAGRLQRRGSGGSAMEETGGPADLVHARRIV